MQKKQPTLFHEVVVKSWWVILFFLIVFFIYDRGLHYRNLERDKLAQKQASLASEKAEALKMRKELLTQIESQSDSAWIELVLMKSLGLVPRRGKKDSFH